MSFLKKVWKDTIAEYPNRRTLTDASGNSTTYTVVRAVGEVQQEGDAWNAENMNNMETRISNAITSCDDATSEVARRMTIAETNINTMSTKLTDLTTDIKQIKVVDSLPSVGTAGVLYLSRS